MRASLKKLKRPQIKLKLPLSKWLVLLLYVAVVAAASFWHAKTVLAHHTGCRRAYAEFGGPYNDPRYIQWRRGDYYYKIYFFGILGNGNAPSGDRIHSGLACSGYSSENVRISSLLWDSNAQGFGAGNVRPDRAYLGLPASLHNNRGIWRTGQENSFYPPEPYRYPPLMANSNWPPESGRPAGGFNAGGTDDGGQALINGRRIWCLGIVHSVPSGTPACGPDPYDPGQAPPPAEKWNLAGALFTESNCRFFIDRYGKPLNCNDSRFFNWYRPWIGTSPDITRFIDRNRNGTIADDSSFNLHMSAVQTYCCGFLAWNIMTFRYPIPPAQIQIDKAAITPDTLIEPGELVRYRIMVRRLSGVYVDSLRINDTVSAPFSYQNSIRTADIHPPPGGAGLVRWNLRNNGAELGRLNNTGLPSSWVTFELQVRGNNVTVRTCGTNVASMTGTDILDNSFSGSNGAGAICVEPPRQPYLTTTGGDIHAGAVFGDEPCLISPNGQGRVWGSQGSATGSKADFVVSSGNDINDFGSAGAPTGTALHFGRFGQYGRVCRPDLFARLSSLPAGGQVVTATTPAQVLAHLTNPVPGDVIVRYNGNLTLSGPITIPVGRHVTLVVDGRVYLTRPGNGAGIVYSGGPYAAIGFRRAVRQIPALAVVARDGLRINNNITRLDGIYYVGTNGVAADIDTCGNGPTGTGPNIASGPGAAANCDNTLVVNGALFANRVLFRRTAGNANSGPPAAETISFLAQHLLQSPPGLNGLFAQLRNDNERPPVY